MRKKRVVFYIIIYVVLLLSYIVTAQRDSDRIIERAADSTVVRIVFGDPAGGFESFSGAPLGKVGVIIIHIMIWLILFVAFSDIFGTFMPFTNRYVPWFVGFGMAVIVANFGFIPTIIGWMAAVTAAVGAGAIFLSMLIAFGFFVLVTWLGNTLKAKILGSKIKMVGEIGSKKTASAIKGLGEAYGAFAKAAKE